MGWSPGLADDETILVSCHTRPRSRVEFDLVLLNDPGLRELKKREALSDAVEA